jgi:hypothetical protein
MSPYTKELIAVFLLSISVLTICIAFNLDKLFTYDSVKINTRISAGTAVTAVIDCSPSIDYPTIEQEVLYCKLKKQYPNCIIFEDFSKKCN